MGTLQVVVGGQYGSEAKGACTAELARRAIERGFMTYVIRVAGPNAGHTAYDPQGRKWALRQIPVAAVVDESVNLYIGAGSEIDPDVLLDEVDRLEEAGIPIRERLVVDEQATVISDAHKEAEAVLVGRIGSTGKGIGAARAGRLLRKSQIASDWFGWFADARINLVRDTAHELYHVARMSTSATIIEGTQGYGLGLHAGHYPQCTSSDCRAIDFIAMAGVDQNWYDGYRVWVVLRTYPIRVAGNSGPLKDESTWEELGFEPERTTVTQKIRRVGGWDADLARAAVIANGGADVVSISLSMADYVVPGIKDLVNVPAEEADELSRLVKSVESDAGASVELIGTGPDSFIRL